MNTHIVSLSLKGANALKKARGFKSIEKAGVQSWVKTSNNAKGVTRHVILPSGTNVIYRQDIATVTKKVITPKGIFFRSIFHNNKQTKGIGQFVCSAEINLKNYKTQRYSHNGQHVYKAENYQIRNNILGNLSLFNFIFK